VHDRQEASSVPNVLVAPKVGPELPPHLQPTDPDSADIDRSIYDNGVGDSRGYYHDGAYTAAPSSPSSASSLPDDYDLLDDDDSSPDRIALRNAALRRAYYAALTDRFQRLRNLLHQTPPPEAIATLPDDHDAYVPPFGPRSSTFRVWSRRLRHTDPIPAQVASMDRHAVLRVLRVLLGGKFLRRGCELRERTSRWLWALLARLPDRGELDYAEVGWVRELGKRAVLMMVSLAQAEALNEEVGGEVLEGEVVEEEEELGDVIVEDDDAAGVSVALVAAPAVVVDTMDGAAGKVVTDHDDSTSAQEASFPAPSFPPPKDDDDDGEDEGGEMAMDIDEGEITDDDYDTAPAAAAATAATDTPTNNTAPTNASSTAAANDDADDLAAAKARLLAQLEEGPSSPPTEAVWEQQQEENHRHNGGTANANMTAEERARLNMRATLNMILTVAGEFYGQRDLLEFRDPFPAAL
jgi:hypothetical protein